MEIRTKMMTLDAGETVPLTRGWFSAQLDKVKPIDHIHSGSACVRAGAGDNCMSCKFQKDNGTC